MSAKFRVVIVSPAAVVAEGAPEKLGDFLRQVGSAIVHKSQISVASREATQVIGVNALVITATDVKEHNGAVVVTDEEGKKFTIPADAFLRSNVSISIEALEEEEEEAPKSKKKKVADPDEEEEEAPKAKKKKVADPDEEEEEEAPKSKKKKVADPDEDDGFDDADDDNAEDEEDEAPKSKKKKVADPDEEDDDFPAPKRGAAKAAGKKKKPADEEVDLDDLDI